MAKFRVEGVGLDTTTLEYQPGEDFEFQYIFTSISSNNENIVKDFSPGAALVTYIDFLDKADEAIISHLELLDRSIVDLLLVDAKCDFLKYADVLSSCVSLGSVDTIGIYGPESVDRIKEIQEVLPNLKYIGLELCPLNFNYEVVSWALENGIDIIGFNPFGGRISAAGLIDSFSVPYLLGFASHYSKLLFLSGRDLFTAADGRDYVSQLIDAEEEEPIYDLEKNVFKLYKPLKKSVHVSIKFDSTYTLPVDNPRSIFSPSEVVLKIGKEEKKTADEIEIVPDSVEDNVYSYYGQFTPPQDTDSDEIRMALLKPRIIDFLELEWPGWNVEFSKLGERIIIFNVSRIPKKGFLKRREPEEYKNYLFSIINGELEFHQLFSSEIPQSAIPEDPNS